MPATPLSPKCHYDANQTVFVAIIPINCICIAPLMKNRYTYFRNFLGIKVNGMIIGDAEAHGVNYTPDGKEAVVEFTGSIPVFAANAKEAVRKVMDSEVEVFGWVNGFAHDVNIVVKGPLTLVNPLSGTLTKVPAALTDELATTALRH